MAEISTIPEERWKEFRDLRLEALKLEPTAFGSSVEEEGAFTEEEWRRRIGSVLFALEDGALVGMLSYLVNTRVKTRHVAHIYGVYVRPARRGNGIGKALLSEALRRIKEHGGVVKVQLDANPEQAAAVRLYEGAGFVSKMKVEKELLVDGRYVDLLYMEKML